MTSESVSLEKALDWARRLYPKHGALWSGEVAALLAAIDDMTGALQAVVAYNGAAPDAVQKMKQQAAATLERMGRLS